MTWKRVCISLDEEIHKRAKEVNLNLSSFIDIKLREYLALIEGKNTNSSSSPSTQKPQGRDDAEGGIRTLAMNKHHQLSRGISRGELEDYLSFKKIQGNCDRWVGEIRRGLLVYLNYIDYNVSQRKTLAFLKYKQERYAISTYRKMIYQIRSFLLFLDVGWAKNIIPPAEPEYTPKRVSKEDIQRTIELVGGGGYGIRYIALILLGASSGMRAEELYQLKTDDIDLDKQIVYINHNPKNGQTTKTKKNRISFFNTETKNALIQYLSLFNKDGKLKHLFFKRQCEKVFQKAPIHVKDLRKFFSQEWDRRGGPTSIKKILMGHSLRGDVDLMHYNYQSEEDLKRIYDKVGIKIN